MRLVVERVAEHGNKGVPQRANVARKFPDPEQQAAELAEHDRKWGIELNGLTSDCGGEVFFLKKKDKYAAEYAELQKLAASPEFSGSNSVQKLLKEVTKKRTKE